MTVRSAMKWLLLLCAATLVVNGLMYLMTGSKEVLYSIFGALGLGAVAAIGMFKF